MAIERRVIVGSPNARLSRFVAAAVRVARDYDSDIDVGYGEREADTKRVLEYLMVLGKARRGEQVLVRPNGKMPGKRWKPMPNSWKGSRVGSAGVVVFVLVLGHRRVGLGLLDHGHHAGRLRRDGLPVYLPTGSLSKPF